MELTGERRRGGDDAVATLVPVVSTSPLTSAACANPPGFWIAPM